MARVAITMDVLQALPGNSVGTRQGAVASIPAAQVTDVTDNETLVEAAIAVLEADGATPTEAHVDDLRAAWDLLVTARTALTTSVAASQAADAVFEYDNAVVTSRNAMKTVLDATLAAATERGLT